MTLWVKFGRKLDVRAESAFPPITDIVDYGRDLRHAFGVHALGHVQAGPYVVPASIAKVRRLRTKRIQIVRKNSARPATRREARAMISNDES
jgi:hypothetical protein